jgi:hypothetical protein
MLGDKIDDRCHNLELSEAVMNEQPNAPQVPDVVLSPVPAPSTQPSNKRPLSWWLKRFLACNPFYLVSAMLLLYGLYQVSIDPRFFSKEVSQLTINYTSLQLYEILLVVTAVFLARRRIFYDSTLLVTLENMLVLVPFILISEAALNEIRIAARCERAAHTGVRCLGRARAVLDASGWRRMDVLHCGSGRDERILARKMRKFQLAPNSNSCSRSFSHTFGPGKLRIGQTPGGICGLAGDRCQFCVVCVRRRLGIDETSLAQKDYSLLASMLLLRACGSVSIPACGIQ